MANGTPANYSTSTTYPNVWAAFSSGGSSTWLWIAGLVVLALLVWHFFLQ